MWHRLVSYFLRMEQRVPDGTGHLPQEADESQQFGTDLGGEFTGLENYRIPPDHKRPCSG